jgi:hypothetical protein
VRRRGDPQGEAEDRGEDESFLRRWNRRKGEAAGRSDQSGQSDSRPPESERATASTGEPGGSVASAEADAGEARGEDARGDEDMPSLDTIDEGGSVADFFSPNVSRGLRRAALRRLFAQSELPVVDELDDYAGDYTKYTRLGDLVTNEMRYRLEVARQRLAKRAEERLAAAETPAETLSATDTPGAAAPDTEDAGRSVSDADGVEDQEDSEHDRSSE